jgi:DNA modification methylase
MMRKTSGKESLEPVLLGERNLAKVLADALLADAEVNRWTHGFHTYPAGLHPDGAGLLVEAFPGRSMLDPFCGGGTTLVEGMAAGRRCVGRDISPVAVRVAKSRTALVDDERLTRFRSRARKMTELARQATERPPSDIYGAVEQWYAPHAIVELESLRKGLQESPEEIRPLLETAFSSILVKTSWRQSDTSTRRVKHRRPKGTTAILFHKKTRELARRLVALREAVPESTSRPDIRFSDARSLSIGPPVDLVLTSPPYPSTYDYLPMQHLRSIWFGDHAKRGERHEIGARRDWRDGSRGAKKRWVDATTAWTKSAAACMSPGGHLVVVIGDGLMPSGTVDTSAPTEHAARAAGLKSVARASVERVDHARDSRRWEHIFAFVKP